MTEPISDETAHRDIAEYLGRVVACEGSEADQWATDILEMVRAALQDPVAVPEWVTECSVYLDEKVWRARLADDPDFATRLELGTGPDPIAAICNALKADTP